KIVSVESQDFLRADSVENPIRKLHFDLLHPSVTGLPDNPCSINDAENVELFCFAGHDVRFNLRALKSDQGTSQSIVATAISHTVGCLKKVVSFHSQRLGRCFAIINRGYQLADTVD